MKQLYKYLNGNVTVTLFDDGTKIQEWDGDAKPIYPNSMDVKITNRCSVGCKWCHEMSNPDGKHADLKYLLDRLINLPGGTELAIGGGNPLEHPMLDEFLDVLKEWDLIPNITVNCKSLEFDNDRIALNQLITKELVYGVGISVTEEDDLTLISEGISKHDNLVYHVIAGVSDVSILDKILESPVNKVLILGYKNIGRGAKYMSKEVEESIEKWKKKLGKYIGKLHLSFDNLALDQLDIKRFLTKKQWDQFYMGKDGQFTMYIDAIEKKYATSSTSKEKFDLLGNIKDVFSHVRELNGFPNNSKIE